MQVYILQVQALKSLFGKMHIHHVNTQCCDYCSLCPEKMHMVERSRLMVNEHILLHIS